MVCHIVTVVVGGRRIDASHAARLERGAVVAPLDPFVRAFAERITPDGTGRRVTIARGARRVTVTLETDGTQPARGGVPVVPLAAVARALGADVDYDARSRTLSIWETPAPLASFTPDAAYVPPPGPLPTFAPKETPAPAPAVTGIPRPRRTPIVVRSAARERG